MQLLFLLRYLDSDGITKQTLDLASGLIQRGHGVTIASAGPRDDFGGLPITSVTERGARHVTVAFPRGDRPVQIPGRALRSVLGLERVVGSLRPDVVHAQWRSLSPFAAWISASRGIPFVTTTHLTGLRSDPLARLLTFWGDVATAMSRETEEELLSNFGLAADRIETIYNGASPERFAPATPDGRREARVALGVPPDAFVVSVIGRLGEEKGQDVVLEALPSLAVAVPSAYVILAGSDNGTEHALRRRAEQTAMSPRVGFVGHVDAVRVLAASDVLALPSRKEGFPLVVVEAMLAGVPVVRTPTSGAGETVQEGRTGRIVPFDDPNELAAALIEYGLDPALARQHGAEGRRSALAKFTVETMIDRYEALYERVRSARLERRTRRTRSLP